MIALEVVLAAFTAVVFITTAGLLVLAGNWYIRRGRLELDITTQALKLQAIIEERVRARTLNVAIDSTGKVVQMGPRRAVGEQPPDPNVRTSSVVDEVHEMEREAMRAVGGDEYYPKRDNFDQPPAPLEI